MKAKLDVMDGYYIMSEEAISRINSARVKLKRVLVLEGDDELTNPKTNTASAITHYLITLEVSKLPTLIRLIKETLENPNSKVIVYVWFKRSMVMLKEYLHIYSPMILSGSTKQSDRDYIVRTFQQPNDTSRLIIAHPVVGGEGISLDDRDGNWPRYMFVIPSFHHIRLHQCIGRILRVSTKSNATARFVYCKDATNESAILRSLMEKCKTVKDSLYKVDVNIKYPGEYQAFYEHDS